MVRRSGCSGVVNVPVCDDLPAHAELKLRSPKPPTQYITVRSCKNYKPNYFADLLYSIFDGEDVNTKLEISNYSYAVES